MSAATKKILAVLTLVSYGLFGLTGMVYANQTQVVHQFFYQAQQWTPPTNVVGTFVIELWGAGGGGAWGGNAADTAGFEVSGATSSILYGSGTLVEAGGGFLSGDGTAQGQGGIALGGDVNTNGNPGTATQGGNAPSGLYLAGGIGGASQTQLTNTGKGGTWPGGGGGMGRYSGTPISGGSGAYTRITLTLAQIGASTTIDVGGGGGGNLGGSATCAGSIGGYGGGGNAAGGSATQCGSATFTQAGVGGGGVTGCGSAGTATNAGLPGGGMVGAGGITPISGASPSGIGGGGGGTPRGDGGVGGVGISTCNGGGGGGGGGGANGGNTSVQGGTFGYAEGAGGAGGIVEITYQTSANVQINQAKVIIKKAQVRIK